MNGWLDQIHFYLNAGRVRWWRPTIYSSSWFSNATSTTSSTSTRPTVSSAPITNGSVNFPSAFRQVRHFLSFANLNWLFSLFWNIWKQIEPISRQLNWILAASEAPLDSNDSIWNDPNRINWNTFNQFNSFKFGVAMFLVESTFECNLPEVDSLFYRVNF